MKALVCVKRVVDYNVKIRVKPDNSIVWPTCDVHSPLTRLRLKKRSG